MSRIRKRNQYNVCKDIAFIGQILVYLQWQRRKLPLHKLQREYEIKPSYVARKQY